MTRRVLRVAIEAKRYAAAPVLEAVHFGASSGEVLAVLAPSGTGKTTLLRIVLGLDRAFAGEVVRPPGRVGTVFQEPRLLPWRDVAANLRLVEPDLSDAAVGELLGVVGLGDVSRQLPRQLSLGMARRVAVARALAVRPALLVLDEPFASLDPMLATGVAHEVAVRARALGAVTLVATHDLEQALAVADRVLVLQGPAPARLAADLTAREASAEDLRERFGFLKNLLF